MDIERGTGIADLVNGTALTRRRALKWVLGAGAAVVAGGVAHGVSATSGSAFFRTSAALNLRAKPSSTSKILLVIPANTLVNNLGSSSNGYNKVSYQGTTGWAYGAYLDETNGGSTDPDVTWIGGAEVTANVNLRSGPGTGYSVLQVVAKGTTVRMSDWVENGFRYVDVDGHGTTGWISDDYVGNASPSGPVSFVTTAAVNLRAQPSLSAKVLKVIPKGATVVDYDLVMSGQFRGVDYNGTTGWVSNSYLAQI